MIHLQRHHVCTMPRPRGENRCLLTFFAYFAYFFALRVSIGTVVFRSRSRSTFHQIDRSSQRSFNWQSIAFVMRRVVGSNPTAGSFL